MPPRTKEGENPPKCLTNKVIGLLSFVTALGYFLSNPRPQNYYDYTFRVAENFLNGHIAFTESQPTWLNEMVPFEGFYYSVFPLGAVLSMIPAAMLKVPGIISEMPGAWIAAILAGVFCFFLFKIAEHYNVSETRKVVQVLGVLFGSFMWTNLTFAGAWQLALGFAIAGEIGAIYFSVYDRRPLIAGLFFAVAFGNRTEILLTAPLFLFLLSRDEKKPGTKNIAFKYLIPRIVAFCAVPMVLGLATLVYNYVRFHSFTDFGYARIPGVLLEPWYEHGVFSLSYLPGQAWEMLFKSWERWPSFPYLRPNGFSATIVWSSPFLLFVLRSGKPRWLQKTYRNARRSLREHRVRSFPSLNVIFTPRRLSNDKTLRYVSWVAMVILTILLWAHGNSGGWQFGYRYAMVLLPWMFVVLLESAPRRITFLEGIAYFFSFAANIYATWLYHWTDYMKP